jgi:chromosome segregation ATPase
LQQQLQDLKKVDSKLHEEEKAIKNKVNKLEMEISKAKDTISKFILFLKFIINVCSI